MTTAHTPTSKELHLEGSWIKDAAGNSVAMANHVKNDAPTLAKMLTAYNAHDALLARVAELEAALRDSQTMLVNAQANGRPTEARRIQIEANAAALGKGQA